MYSISYLHEGASKTWYGVSARDADRFETAFSDAFAATVDIDPELYIKKASMVPPWQLLEKGIPVCRALQEPGQFIVTLPQGYHAGFSHGFNTAEAVNFMIHDWLPYAEAAQQRYQLLAKEPCIDVHQILVSASRAGHSPEVHAMLGKVVDEELHWRHVMRQVTGCISVEMTARDKATNLGRSPPCDVCGQICHFGFVQLEPIVTLPQATASHKQTTAQVGVVCTRHCDVLRERDEREGGSGRLYLHMRYDDDALGEMAQSPPSLAAKSQSSPQSPTLPEPRATAAVLPKAVEAALQEKAKR